MIRDVDRRPLDGTCRDVRLAIRSLRATPVVTAAAIVSLALGIGANSAIFSLIDGLVLRPLPGVVEPARLVTLSAGRSNPAAPRWPYVFWTEIQRRGPSFGGALAWSGSRFDVSAGSETQRIDGGFVSGDYFATLGVTAFIGRTLTEADDVNGGGAEGAVAVISHSLWQRRFAGSPQALGMPLTINSTPFTIVGVMPPEFRGTEVGHAFDVAIPIAAEPLIRGNESSLRPPADRAGYWLTVAIRLRPGQSDDAATRLLRGMQPQIWQAAQPQVQGHSLEFLTEPFTLTRIGTGTSGLRATYQRPLLALLFVVGLVLLLACANIANLQLARATAREHEWSIRRALGAAPWQLVRPLLIESLLVAAVGASAGLAFASWAGRLLVAGMSTSTNRISLDLPLDWRVLTFTTLVACATALLFGSAPAIFAGRTAPIDAIKVKGRGLTGEGRVGLPGGIISAQVGLSLIIVVFAELFVGTFQHLARRSLGFDSSRVLLVRVDTARAAAPNDRGAFFQRLVAAAASAPGVQQAAGSFTTPVSGNYSNAFVHITGTPRQPPGPRIHSSWNFVTPEWFSTYGTPLRAGRDFDGHDVQGAAPVVIVNESFVRRFFSSGTAVGSTIDVTGGLRGELPFGTKTIVGVVGDAIYSSLREEPQPSMYFPLSQWFLPFQMDWALNIGVRSTSAAPAILVPGVNSALERIDSSLRIEFRTLDTQVSESLTQERLIATLSGFFAGLALLLAAIGLYGVTAYTVTRRRTEIGVRMALGARQLNIVRLALTRVSILVGVGIATGSWASLILSQSVTALLYGLAPQDPGVLAGASLLLAAVAALASGLPAWRASLMDPTTALRQDQ
jgi:putative ABC transport system permease protein